MSITTHYGDCRAVLDTLEPSSVQTIVTSPPYWRLRRYTGSPDEIGQEDTPAAYVEALRDVFSRARRVLRDDGTLWLNLGDAYESAGGRPQGKTGQRVSRTFTADSAHIPERRAGLPPKSLIGLPWRVAFALQDDGWVLRSEIIWEKPNAMPESVTDRPTRSHEHLFLFAKRPRYYYDAGAIAETAMLTGGGTRSTPDKAARVGQGTNGTGLTTLRGKDSDTRNARTVWAVSTSPLADEHYAPMPQALAERCIKAGSRPGDVVLDMFAGSGTTGRAAVALQRGAVLIDLAYADLQERRLDGVQIGMVELEDAA